MVEPLFVDVDLKTADQITLTGAEAKHAIAVRRMRIGEAISITNGKGLRLRGVVVNLNKDSLEIQVDEIIQENAPALQFTLVQALAKGDRDELAIQAATELGVFAIIPWSTDRSISRWEGNKKQSGKDRWQQIVLEASKQSLRSFIPEVEDVIDSPALAKRLAGFDLALVLDPSGGKSLSEINLPTSGKVAIVVGPEGGISKEELEAFSSSEQISLGSNILRTSTAGPAVLAALTLGRNQP
jgi:16S rRNA (uracil1498-N3)-methyltransferase